MGKALVIIVTCLVLAGCQTTRTGSLCPVGPFIPDAGASTRWTANEQDQLIVLNESGEKICGWRAP